MAGLVTESSGHSGRWEDVGGTQGGAHLTHPSTASPGKELSNSVNCAVAGEVCVANVHQANHSTFSSGKFFVRLEKRYQTNLIL